ncbi:MAG TPA: 4-(cytidine 5'-diphospho)-2-C-methyl-D-erythritol kinase [Thermoanaerobaculia bacterium]|nr:4-(cytidine 5'-diphospho)-2-C-methyl-D-erythritol kinase [Thermoanaerobaculia bacterium]
MIQARSYAKINWSLRVTGKRADGFHDLETVFQLISLHDTLTFTESDRLVVTCDDRTIPTDERNLVVKAARALGVDRVAIHIEKRIPSGGGLGGGSSNAAATLIALSKMFNLDRPLESIALQLGSDVPFFFVGGTAYATGRGEVITPLPDAPKLPLLLVLPRQRVSTAEAFRSLTHFSPALGIEAYVSVWRGLPARAPGGAGGPGAQAGSLRHTGVFTNDFEEPVFARFPQLRTCKEKLYEAGAQWAAMSGSGSTIVGAFPDLSSRDAARSAFQDVRTETAVVLGGATPA